MPTWAMELAERSSKWLHTGRASLETENHGGLSFPLPKQVQEVLGGYLNTA